MYPLNEVRQEISKRYFGRIFEDVIGYLNLYDYVKLKLGDTTGKMRRVSIETFWFSMLGDRFAYEDTANFLPMKSGDTVKFQNVFLTEWAPKLPGQIWTTSSMRDLAESQKRVDGYVTLKSGPIPVLDPYGKERALSAGFGSVRIQPDRNDEKYCMFMNLVNERAWHCDYGVPLVVSRSVYNAYLEHSHDGAPFLTSVEGVLHINEELPFKKFIPKAIGASLSTETEEALRYRPNLPRCFVYVASPLSLKFKSNNTHPTITAWTMFETYSNNSPYRYTYVQFDPTLPEGFDEAGEFINSYVRRYDGKALVTDFDGLIPRLESRIPLSSNPMRKKKESKQLLSALDEWAQKSIRRAKREG
jgi:hypothetical protein